MDSYLHIYNRGREAAKDEWINKIKKKISDLNVLKIEFVKNRDNSKSNEEYIFWEREAINIIKQNRILKGLLM